MSIEVFYQPEDAEAIVKLESIAAGSGMVFADFSSGVRVNIGIVCYDNNSGGEAFTFRSNGNMPVRDADIRPPTFESVGSMIGIIERHQLCEFGITTSERHAGQIILAHMD